MHTHMPLYNRLCLEFQSTLRHSATHYCMRDVPVFCRRPSFVFDRTLVHETFCRHRSYTAPDPDATSLWVSTRGPGFTCGGKLDKPRVYNSFNRTNVAQLSTHNKLLRRSMLRIQNHTNPTSLTRIHKKTHEEKFERRQTKTLSFFHSKTRRSKCAQRAIVRLCVRLLNVLLYKAFEYCGMFRVAHASARRF